MFHYAQRKGIMMERARAGINVKISLSDSSQDEQGSVVSYSSYVFVTHFQPDTWCGP